MLPARSAKGSAALLAGALLTVCAARGEAQRRYDVRVDSKPPGATVYFDVGDQARVEITPADLRLRPGSYTMIFELDGYADKVMDITVRRSRKEQSILAELEPFEPAFVEVKASSQLRGALVRIDGEEAGEAPDDFEVGPGAHLVEVVEGGEVAHEQWIDVAAGQRVTVMAGDPADVSETQDPFDDEETPDALGDEDKAEIKKEAPPAAAEGELLVVGAGLELGGRRFRFDNARRLNDMQKSLRPYDAFGLPLFRILAEVYPLGRSGNPTLSGLGVTGTYARAAPFQSTADQAIDPVDTSFSDFALGVLYRYPVSPTFYVGGRVTYAGQTFDFDDGDSDPMSGIDSEVPSVDYRFIRIGADVGGDYGRFVFFGGASLQRVNEVGELADRFSGTNISAYGGRAGVSTELVPSIELRLLATYNIYMLTFQVADENSATYVADGGTDQFYGVMFSGVYVY